MKKKFAIGLVLVAALVDPVFARSTIDLDDASGGGSDQPNLECVPYAREVTGIRIYGDAHTWWDQAAGHYARGTTPRVGAVMALEPHGNSHLGHVAAVSKIVDDRTVLISHANWSERGKIEENVEAVDVSPDNDWSEVRIWYGPSHALGSGHWPVYGFIYNAKPGKSDRTRDSMQLTVTYRQDPIGAIIAANQQ